MTFTMSLCFVDNEFKWQTENYQKLYIHLIKSAKVHGAPVDPAAQLADVDHVAVSSYAHLLHDGRTHRLSGGCCSHLPCVLQLELKQVRRIRLILRPILMTSEQMPSPIRKCIFNSVKVQILCKFYLNSYIPRILALPEESTLWIVGCCKLCCKVLLAQVMSYEDPSFNYCGHQSSQIEIGEKINGLKLISSYFDLQNCSSKWVAI